MSPEDQRIAIAEACGWKWSAPHFGHDGIWHSTPYKDGTDIWDCDISDWAGKPKDVVREIDELPDYLNDLNAMHEAFLSLNDSQKLACLDLLYEVARGNHYDKDAALAMATLPQWSMSFLRTIGKWTEQPNAQSV